MKSQSEQRSPLYASGALPFSFDFDRDATTSWDGDADLDVDDMEFAFCCELEQQETLEIVIYALCELQRLDPERLRRWQSSCRPLKLEPWDAQMPMFAYVRDRLDDGVIRIFEHEGTLAISLPHADLWDAHGLDWLNNHQKCCAPNRDNPAPWRGPSCGCTPAEASHRKQQ